MRTNPLPVSTVPDSIEARKHRWERFLAPDAPPGYLYVIDLPGERADRPLPWPTNMTERIDWAWRRFDRMMQRADIVADDTVPFLDVYTGTEIFGEALGCLVYRPEFDMPCARPLITRATDVASVKVPELSTSTLAPLFDLADTLRQRAGDGAVLRLVDVQSPMDIAATLWDKGDFYTALFLEPHAVRDLAAKAMELLCAFLDVWFGRYGPAFVAHYPDYYMPEGVTVSEDEVGVVDRTTFERLFLPELEMMAQRYGSLGMHCCANARHQWPVFAGIANLRLLNLVQPPSILREAYGCFASCCAQMHSWCGDGEPASWPAQLPGDVRAVLTVQAQTDDDAVRLGESLWSACGRG